MKKWISVILVLATAFGLILVLPFSASADSLYIRKIVSVVYDDSGSMLGSNWAYANYAMQAFCGMLNSEDQLYVTYMSETQSNSNYDPERLDLSAGGIQQSVDSIRNHTKSGGTPYGAVEIAFDKLKSVYDANPNTQYWLVVITDGDFDESYTLSDVKKKEFLNDNFKRYQESVMPNGTAPQITYLGIGNITVPDEKQGVYTYSAQNATDITRAMSDMADRISGRTRLAKTDMKQIDDKTVQVSSSIPLLNIAVFAQESGAAITGAVCDGTLKIPVGRKVSLSYPGYASLSGGASLLGDSKNVIPAGTYSITFDQKVDINDIVVLFEPALEIRMKITVNGKEIEDLSALDDLSEGDTVSVSCKIYEMGTDTEIDPALMPNGTQFEISISEGGKVVDTSTDSHMQLSNYTLKNIETRLKATMQIVGFNPIQSEVTFTPMEYVPKIVYSVTASFTGDTRSVKFDDIAANRDLAVSFTVYADGVAITDPEAVKALNPTVSASPAGNTGTVTYTQDGKIVFTPNAASEPETHDGSYRVDVTCTLEDGAAATETYTVLLSEYRVIPINADQTVKKTKFFGNQVGVSFYITKDGVQLDKQAVQQQIVVQLNKDHKGLKTDISVADDGTITVIPYSTQDHPLTFGSWFCNWWYYFGLEGDDVVITLSHEFGTARAVVDVVGESVKYQLLNVYLPLLLEIAIALYLIWWVYAIWAKPKFLPGAVLYIANLSYGGKRGHRYHEIDAITEVNLKQYNALKYRLSPTLKSKKHYVGKNLTISAGYGGSIICHSEVWYKGDITPKDKVREDLSHPQYVKTYINDHDSLKIRVINIYDGDDVHAEESIDNPNSELYYVHTNMANVGTVDGMQVIDKGTIFAYAIRINN